MSLILLGVLNAQAAGAAAGAYDLLETQVLSSSASSVTFTGLGSYTDYKHLQIRWSARVDNFSNRNLKMRVNGSSSSGDYDFHYLAGRAGSVSSGSFGRTETEIVVGYQSLTGSSNASYNFGVGVIDALDFSSTSKATTFRTLTGQAESSNVIALMSGLYTPTTAVTSLSFFDTSANFTAGSRFSIYGLR